MQNKKQSLKKEINALQAKINKEKDLDERLRLTTKMQVKKQMLKELS